MFSFRAASRWKIRRAPQHEVKLLFFSKNPVIPKVTLPDVVAAIKPVPTRRLSCEPNAFFLCLDRHKSGSLQTPCRNHADRSHSAAKIKNRARRRAGTRPIPRSQDVVGRKTMPISQLENPEEPADRIKGFAGPDLRPPAQRAWRNRPGLCPALENGCSVIWQRLGLRKQWFHGQERPTITQSPRRSHGH